MSHEENKRVVQNAIRKKTAEAVAEVDLGDFNKLKNAAKDFLTNVQIVSDMYESCLSKKQLSAKITEMYKNMRDATSYTQKVLHFQHEFETSLNNFLGRTIYLTYVTDSGDFNFYGDANIGKLYETATANRGRGNISASKMFDANDLQENIQQEINESILNKMLVYQTALKRYRKNDGDEEYMNYRPSDRTFYWWLQYHKKLGGWTDPIVNEGPIAEGYAGAVINQDKDISNRDIENSLALLWNRYIGKDSIGAALKGDIVYKDDGNIQFAIKKGSFSTAMVRQYLVLAYNIMQLKRLSVEDLQNPKIFSALTKTTKVTNAVLEYLNGYSEKVVNEKIDKDSKIWQDLKIII